MLALFRGVRLVADLPRPGLPWWCPAGLGDGQNPAAAGRWRRIQAMPSRPVVPLGDRGVARLCCGFSAAAAASPSGRRRAVGSASRRAISSRVSWPLWDRGRSRRFLVPLPPSAIACTSSGCMPQNSARSASAGKGTCSSISHGAWAFGISRLEHGGSPSGGAGRREELRRGWDVSMGRPPEAGQAAG